MKQLSKILVPFVAAAALAAGCKGDSAKAKPTAAEQRTTDEGPLVTAHGPGLGADQGGTQAQRLAARVARERAQRADGDGGADRGPRGWVGGEELTPEERQARREEMRAKREERRKEMLGTFDADHDGKLSPDERKAMHESRIAEMVDRLDVDGDGKLSKQELADLAGRGRFAPPEFANLDVDRDGFVTADEMTKVMPQRGPRNRGDFRGSGDGLRGGQPGPRAPDGTAPE